MKNIFRVPLALLLSLSLAHAGIFDLFGLGKKSTNQPAGQSAVLNSPLSQEQVVLGLKEALGKGVQRAITQLGQDGGFLTNLNVKIPMPEKLRPLEKTLRALKQDRLVDEFVATMNHAAEQAVPGAAAIFTDAIRSMSMQDATTILTGTNTAATAYFRTTTETNLFQTFLPIVKNATARTGVTSAYKQLLDAAGGTSFGSLGRSLLGAESVDIDVYVTGKSLDGLFKMIAEEEKRIRENPLARTSDILQKVFGAVTTRFP